MRVLASFTRAFVSLRTLSRMGVALVLVGAAGLGPLHAAGADESVPAEEFTMTARADTFAFQFIETATPAAPGGEVFDASPSTAQALLDSVGRSEGYAAAPTPGPFFATLPSNGNGVIAGLGIAFAFPDYPFYANSSHPVKPSTDTTVGPFHAKADSDQQHSTGEASSGGPAGDQGAFMSSRAAAAVGVDPGTGVRSADAASRFDGFTVGPLALGQSLASAKLTQSPGQAPAKTSSFTVASFTIAGVQVALTDRGFKLGDQAPPTADLATLMSVLGQAGITVEFIPAHETPTSIDSAGMRITRAGQDPNGTQHKISLVIGRVGASIHASSTPLADVLTPVVDVPTDQAAPAGDPSPVAPPASASATADLDGANAAGSYSSESVPSSTAGSETSSSGTAGSTGQALGATQPVMQLASPLSIPPVRGPNTSGFYVVLLAAGLVMTVGTRLVAAVGVKLGFWTAYGAPVEAPVSALRLPQR
jgi:hypothetical protein